MSIRYLNHHKTYDGGGHLEVTHWPDNQQPCDWYVYEPAANWVWATASTELEAHVAMNTMNTRTKDPTP